MEPITDARSPQAVAAMEENFRGWLPLFERLEGARLEHRYGCVAWTSSIRMPFFNGVIGSPMSDRPEDAIDEILAPYDGADIPLLWVMPPPLDHVALLEARGFEVSREAGMVLDLSSLGPVPSIDGVSVREVDGDPSALETAIDIALSTNGMPTEGMRPLLDALSRIPERARMRAFLATVDGEPAATSTLWQWAGVAGLFNVGTLPGFRGRGLGRLVSTAAMDAGRADGYRVGVLQSSEMAESLYRSMGFEEQCRYAFAVRGSREEP